MKSKTLKHSPRNVVIVGTIKPAFLPLKECYKYVGMEAKLFREVSREFGLSVYARGRKKILHKVSDLDAMMENLKIIDGNKRAKIK